MKIKALVSFSGAFSMCKGEVLEYGDEYVLQDLLTARYVEEVEETPKKKVKKNENK